MVNLQTNDLFVFVSFGQPFGPHLAFTASNPPQEDGLLQCWDPWES